MRLNDASASTAKSTHTTYRKPQEAYEDTDNGKVRTEDHDPCSSDS